MTNHPYTEIALLEGKLKAANDLLSTQGRLLRQAVEELDKEIAKRREAEAEIERRGKRMEALHTLLWDAYTEEQVDYHGMVSCRDWFDSDGNVKPWGRSNA